MINDLSLNQKPMKALVSSLLILFVLSTTYAQKRTLDLGSFTQVSFGTPGSLYITQGSNEEVVVECSDSVFDDLEFEVSGDRLSIRNKSRRNWMSRGLEDVDVYITMKTIERLALSGSGNLVSENTLNVDDLDLRLSGSGDMDLDLDGEEVEIKISGSGNIELAGNADEAQASISGSGRVQAEDLEVKSFEAAISGSGRCYITVTEEINARISGSGSIYYAGDPDRVYSDSSGSGKVRKMRD